MKLRQLFFLFFFKIILVWSVVGQLFQYHLLKRLSFFHLSIISPLLRLVEHICVGLFCSTLLIYVFILSLMPQNHDCCYYMSWNQIIDSINFIVLLQSCYFSVLGPLCFYTNFNMILPVIQKILLEFWLQLHWRHIWIWEFLLC